MLDMKCVINLEAQQRGRIGTVPPVDAGPVTEFDDKAARPVDCAINSGAQIGANIFDGGHWRTYQVAPEFNRTCRGRRAGRSRRRIEPHHGTLDSINTASKHNP